MSVPNKKFTSVDSRLPAVIAANQYLIANAEANAFIQTAAAVQNGTYRGVTHLSDYGINDSVSDFGDELVDAFSDAPEGSVIVFPSELSEIRTSIPVIIPKSNKGLKILQNGVALGAHAGWDNNTVGGKGLLHFEGGSGAEDSWEHVDFVLQNAVFNPNGKQARGISMGDFRLSGNEPDHIKGGSWYDIKGEGSGSVAGYELIYARGLENGNIFTNVKAEGWKVDGMAATPADHLTTVSAAKQTIQTHAIVRIEESDNNGNWTWIGGKLSPATSGTNGGCMMLLAAKPSPLNRDRIIGTHFFGRKGTFGITGLLEVWQDGGGRYNNRTHVREAFSIEDCKIAWDIWSDASSGARGYMVSNVGLENKNDDVDFETDHRLLRINGQIQGSFKAMYMMCQGGMGSNTVWNYVENNSTDPIEFYPNDIQMRSSAQNDIMRIFQGSALILNPRKFHMGGTDTIKCGRTGQFSGSAARFFSPYGDSATDETSESDIQQELAIDDFIIRDIRASWDVNTRTAITPLEFRINGVVKATLNVPAGGGSSLGKAMIGGNVDYRNVLADDSVFAQNSLASFRLNLANGGGTGNLRFTGINVTLQKIGNVQRGIV